LIVCVCNRINERTVCAAQRACGARCADDIFDALNLEPRCGSCVPEMESLIVMERQEQRDTRADVAA